MIGLHNTQHTLALLLGMAMVLGALGWMLAGWAGVVWALFMVIAPLHGLGMAGIPWLALILPAFAPLVSNLTQLGISRTREYDAARVVAALTVDPEVLARTGGRREPLTLCRG